MHKTRILFLNDGTTPRTHLEVTNNGINQMVLFIFSAELDEKENATILKNKFISIDKATAIKLTKELKRQIAEMED